MSGGDAARRSPTLGPPVLTTARRGFRIGPVTGVWRPRAAAVAAVAAVLLVVVCAVNLGRGDFPIPVTEVVRILLGGGDSADAYIVTELRLPRTLTGVFVGAALGLSGALTQAVARNPLASPDILGVTDGASLFAVASVVLAGGAGVSGLAVSPFGTPIAALAGGLVAAALVHALAYRKGLDGFRLLLVGVGISSAAVSLTTYLLVSANVQQAGQVLTWLRGSLASRSWENVVPAALVVAIGLPFALVLAFRLAALELGDESARGLGLRVDRARAGVVGVAVALAAVATACAGPIRFVALVVPQILLRLSGGSRPPLVGSALGGALLVVTADLVARTVLGEAVPVGVVTVVGAPYLLYLLVRPTRRRTV
ncbi:FecCD family ABC transporter permease [Actinomycetospora chiangmaiensis]|uniref:FecCD family ABC transporter permease n=1 Tax=Actinomycetospora chiangmaiensis TaxID=402650 RepID=UPI00037F445F|nr:iron ABC transporter permease [Actinomycetospora chiangmaiensis]